MKIEFVDVLGLEKLWYFSFFNLQKQQLKRECSSFLGAISNAKSCFVQTQSVALSESSRKMKWMVEKCFWMNKIFKIIDFIQQIADALQKVYN